MKKPIATGIPKRQTTSLRNHAPTYSKVIFISNLMKFLCNMYRMYNKSTGLYKGKRSFFVNILYRMDVLK